MVEASTRTATLDDIETEDFVRFCQFAYTGDYSTPLWEVVEPEAGQESAPAPDDEVKRDDEIKVDRSHHLIRWQHPIRRQTSLNGVGRSGGICFTAGE
jgi:hypothetical protein